MSSGETIVDAIREHARSRPDETALVFTRGEGDDDHLTYRELDRRACVFAGLLRTLLPEGALVLLPVRSGASSVVALCACLYAGLPCAPVPLPARNGSMRRLEATASASGCTALVVPGDATYLAASLPGLSVISEDRAHDSMQWTPGDLRESSLALVQYTSGSTSDPKGVLLSHANIVANLEMLRLAFRVGPDDRYASWLPLFHDMGLMAAVFMPLHFGVCGVIMPPLTFLRRPERWLQMVHHHGATITGAPNFAYETCARRLQDDDIAALDLSRLRLAFCGAEPVRRSTMQRFAGRFKLAGFRPSALYPCYGMAEAVTFVSGGFLSVEEVQDEAPSVERARPVSCGTPAVGSNVAIVDPVTRQHLANGNIGEVWIAGPHIAQGYLGQPAATRERFGARLAAFGGIDFLRTGDLGVFDCNGLTITGRLKDIIVYRGSNIHAADIEAIVAACHPGFGPTGAAFAWEVDEAEHIVLVQEAARGDGRPPRADMLRAALDAVALHHGVRLHELIVVRAGSIPKTSSGKVRRDTCRELYARRALQAIFALSDQA